jgi:hypothetical protein
LSACDSQSGEVVCIVSDTVPYIATIDASGAPIAQLALDPAVSTIFRVTLTPDGSKAFVFGTNGGLGNIEPVDLATMSSLGIINTDLDTPNVVKMAPDAGQIWFTAKRFKDSNGGYQVLEDPALIPQQSLALTGVDASAVTMTGTGILLVGFGFLIIVILRRRAAK